MKKLKILSTLTGLAALLAAPAVQAAESTETAKPYPLDTCVVSGEKLGADASMKPYVFTHEGQEVKLCCKSCLKDFKKDPAKYVKQIEAAQAKKK